MSTAVSTAVLFWLAVACACLLLGVALSVVLGLLRFAWGQIDRRFVVCLRPLRMSFGAGAIVFIGSRRRIGEVPVDFPAADEVSP